MAQATGSYNTMVKARNTFYGYVLGCAGLMVVIQFIPKAPADQFFRLILMIMFFTCFASLTWSFSTPYRDYLQSLYAWRYSEAAPSISRTATMYVHRTCRVATGLAWIGTTGATLLGLWVFSHWAQGNFLVPIQSPLKFGWWISFALVPVYLLTTAGMIKEARQLHQTLEEQVALAGIKPLDDADARAQEQQRKEPPVTINGPLSFRAGGFNWDWSDFYKNTAIFGQSGSGKTVCVLNALLEGLIGSSAAGGRAASGLILDPKGDFRDKIALLCGKYGRADDLMIIDPGDLTRSIRWNPLDSPDDELEIAGRFAGVLETLNQKGDKDAYWVDSAKVFIRHIIALLREVKGPDGEPPSFHEIYECATSESRLSDWCGKVQGDPPPKPARRAIEYVVNTWEELAPETKSVVRSFIANMLDPFLMDPYEDLFSGRSTLSISAMIDRGKILYVYMPIADKETMAKVVSTFVKLEFYREVLKRPDKERPSFFLCDEFQAFFTAGGGRGDADVFERTRQSNHANVVAFQNLPALLKQAPNKEPVDSLLGNCAIKIFLRNSEKATNEYASGLFGEHVESLVGAGMSTGQGRGGTTSRSISANAQYSARIKKDVFPALAQPSRPDAIDYAETMVHLGARGRVTHERLRWKVHPLKEG